MAKLSRRAAAALTSTMGALILATTLPTWVRALAPTATGEVAVAAAGTTAAPAAASIALVIVAAGAVLALAGRWVRVLALAGVILGALAAALTVGSFLSAPDVVAAGAAAEVTSVRAVLEPVTLTPWPYVNLGTLLAAAGLGGWLLTRLGTWTEVGRRYERAPRPSAPAGDDRTRARRQAMDDWDALSRGEDPS